MTEFIDLDAVRKYRMNHGGCAIIAVLLVDKVGGDGFAWCDKYASEAIPNTSCSHVLACMGDDIFDVEGSTTETDLKKNHGFSTYKVNRQFILDCIYNGLWSHHFDNRNTKKIAKMLGVIIADDLKKAMGYVEDEQYEG